MALIVSQLPLLLFDVLCSPSKGGHVKIKYHTMNWSPRCNRAYGHLCIVLAQAPYRPDRSGQVGSLVLSVFHRVRPLDCTSICRSLFPFTLKRRLQRLLTLDSHIEHANTPSGLTMFTCLQLYSRRRHSAQSVLKDV